MNRHSSVAPFYIFKFFIDLKIKEEIHVGSPKSCVVVNGIQRWGCSDPEMMFPRPQSIRIPWIDDERVGFAGRTIHKPEDALGVEGRVGDMTVRFDSILDTGRNVVVYALYCPAKQIRMAYGFNRHAFEPGYEYPHLKSTVTSL